MDIVGLYKKMILSLVPDNLEKGLKTDKGTLGDGIKNYALAAILAAIIAGIGILVQSLMFGAPIDAVIISIIMMLIVMIIAVIIGTLINTGLSYIWCKLLGGKGTFSDQYYQFSIVGSGLLIVTSVLMLVPFVGGLVAGLLAIYYLYPVFLVYRSVHKFTDGRAALAVLLPFVLLIILAIIAMMFFAVMLAGIFGAMSASGAYPTPY
jgi:hypothetical protein